LNGPHRYGSGVLLPDYYRNDRRLHHLGRRQHRPDGQAT
jgi:hypothetical protein